MLGNNSPIATSTDRQTMPILDQGGMSSARPGFHSEKVDSRNTTRVMNDSNAKNNSNLLINKSDIDTATESSRNT